MNPLKIRFPLALWVTSVIASDDASWMSCMADIGDPRSTSNDTCHDFRVCKEEVWLGRFLLLKNRPPFEDRVLYIFRILDPQHFECRAAPLNQRPGGLFAQDDCCRRGDGEQLGEWRRTCKPHAWRLPQGLHRRSVTSSAHDLNTERERQNQLAPQAENRKRKTENGKQPHGVLTSA